MKTVKGEVLSTTPISISKAALILSKFVSADTGASQAVCAYLQRASASFNDLNQLHKELKSYRRHKTPKEETVIEDGEPGRTFILNQPDGEESESKKHNNKKKKKKKKKERGWFGNIEKSEGESVEDKVRVKIVDSDLGVEDEKKKHKKKRAEVGNLEDVKSTGKVKNEEDGNVRIEDTDRKKHEKNKGEKGDKFGYLEEDKNRIKTEEDGTFGMDNGRKKHKKKRELREYQVGDLKENGAEIVEEEEKKKKKKKRKSEEIEEGRETNAEESRSKKKKKRKGEGER